MGEFGSVGFVGEECGFIVAFHRLDRNDRVKKYFVGPSIRGFRVANADDGALYLTCVVTQGSSFTSSEDDDEDNAGAVATEEEEDLDTYELDNTFYVLPLEWKRKPREAEEDDGEGVFDFGAFFSNNPFGNAEEDNEGGNWTLALDENDLDFDSLPSTNDTDLMVGEPTVVNLDSQSSKCLQIRTPKDPSRLSLIDNKRMSIMIGVTAGLIVFVIIILRFIFI